MGVNIFAGPNADVTASSLSILAQKAAQSLTGTANWLGIKQLVSNGLGPKAFPVGTQIADEWKQTNASDPLTAIWDVVHHSNEGMELNWHYAFPDGMPFDNSEAIYYAPAGGLAAGQYYITISMNYGTGWIAGQHINFTLTAAMDEGDQLVINYGAANAINPTAGRTWNIYAKGSTTSKQSGTTSNSDAGTEVGATHATKTSIPNGNVNSPQRAIYGYGRWSQSAVRQYLNSAGAAGAWWTPQNPWDRPPAQAETIRGWLGGCSADFIDSIATSEVITAIDYDDALVESKTTDTTYDKIYLPSLKNLYIASDRTDADGNEWDYYKELAIESGLSGKFQRYSTYPVLIKYSVAVPTSPVVVWTRSCYSASSSTAWLIGNNGNIYGSSASFLIEYGCPACKIAKN